MIPMQSLVQSTKEKSPDTLNIHIFCGKEKNGFVFYEDDGRSMGYTQNKCCKRKIVFDPAKQEIIFLKQEGNFAIYLNKVQLIYMDFRIQ